MDIKITGTEEIMQVALDQAKGGCTHILSEMSKALTHARDEMGEYAPKIETIQVPQDKIRSYRHGRQGGARNCRDHRRQD